MTNELIEAIKNGTTAEFHQKYRQVDILLVDDIQFISGKTSTQEEFFHTFETLHAGGKQIVLTSDRPPREIATLEERLRSRFEMGLLADIQPPDLETRIAIIRRKAKTLDMPLQDDVAEYIANQLKSNVRQLEGVVKRMRAQYLLNNEQPNLIAAQNAIRDIRNDNQPAPITVERIINEVARTMGVEPEDTVEKQPHPSPCPAGCGICGAGYHRSVHQGHRAGIRRPRPHHHCVCHAKGGGTDGKGSFLQKSGAGYYQEYQRNLSPFVLQGQWLFRRWRDGHPL